MLSYSCFTSGPIFFASLLILLYDQNDCLTNQHECKCKDQNCERKKLPPTIAQTLVRKCRNETCSSVKVTCTNSFIN